MSLSLESARQWYQTEDSVHDFSHIERVYRMADRIAREEKADLEIVHAAALLHDSKGSLSGSEERAGHHIQSAQFAGTVLAEKGWPDERIEAVQHCIRAHRYRGGWEKPETIEAKVLFDADKLDVIGAIGVARVIGYAALAGQPFYVEPSRQFLETGKETSREPHSAYHEYLFKLAKIKDNLFTETAHRIAKERHAYIRDYFLILAAEINGEK